MRIGSASFLILWLVGCATYQQNQSSARDKIRSHSYNEAVTMLEERANKEGDDQLVYLLDYATALQLAGRYKDSNKAFSRAEKIADIQDYHSLSRIAGSILLTEELVQYKGEDFEKVMINALAAINYLELGDLENALVEVRRLNNKLHKYKIEAKKNYEQNAFAFYISGAIWEADGKWDDAYIAYKNVYDLNPDFPLIQADLIRAARKAQRPEEVEKWRKRFTAVKENPDWNDRKKGELVVVFQQGWGPHKRPRPESPRFPMLTPTPSDTRKAEVVVYPADGAAPESLAIRQNASTEADSGPAPASTSTSVAWSAKTESIYSVQDVAIKTLDDAYAALVAKRVAGIVAKEVVADQIRQKNELLGAVAWVALHATDRADLRQWSTLPETFQMARLYLPPGKYKLRFRGLNSNSEPSGEKSEEREIEIRANKKVFASWRSTL